MPAASAAKYIARATADNRGTSWSVNSAKSAPWPGRPDQHNSPKRERGISLAGAAGSGTLRSQHQWRSSGGGPRAGSATGGVALKGFVVFGNPVEGIGVLSKTDPGFLLTGPDPGGHP